MDTLLHMDMADAINFLIYMEGLGKDSEWWLGNKVHTLWLLWLHEDVEPLREYVQEHF